jgi:integrase
MPVMTDKEWQRYLMALPSPTYKLFFSILIHTGADVGEVIALRLEDLFCLNEVPRIRFRRTKIANAHERMVPIPRALAYDILARVKNIEYVDGTLFPYATDYDLRQKHEIARKAIGRPDLRRKDFRHLAAIAWRKAGVGIETIKERLGHSSIAMTMRYAAFRPSDEFDQKGTEEAAKLITG